MNSKPIDSRPRPLRFLPGNLQKLALAAGMALRSKRLTIGLCLVLSTIVLRAHDPGLSTATVQVGPAGIEAVLSFNLKDAAWLLPPDQSGKAALTRGDFTDSQSKFMPAVAEEFIVQANGHNLRPSASHSQVDSLNNVQSFLSYAVKVSSNLQLHVKLLARLPGGHRQLVTVQTAAGEALAQRLLSARDNSISLDVAAALRAPVAAELDHKASIADFLVLGVKHILTGYDHLLFLLALMVVTSRLIPALKIITCFTLAHSITLAVATLSWIQIPSKFVEPLIAASIVYVGIENLFRGDDPKGRWLLTFAFGLIHGFGFASVLRELGVGTAGGGIVVPLFSFNFGVELGQIMVAALALPVIWKLRTHSLFIRVWVPICSAVVVLAGGFWFVERVWF